MEKKTVYLPIKVEDELPKKDGKYCVLSRCNTTYVLETYDTLNFTNGKFQEVPNWNHVRWLKEKESFVFTESELNEYTVKVIKQALETAADKAETEYIEPDGCATGDYYDVSKESITNTFEKIFNKFKI